MSLRYNPIGSTFKEGDVLLLVEEGKKPLFLNINPVFPYTVTICALQKRKKKYLYPRKTKDTAQDTTNVNILRAALTTYLCCSEVNLERK